MVFRVLTVFVTEFTCVYFLSHPHYIVEMQNPETGNVFVLAREYCFTSEQRGMY